MSNTETGTVNVENSRPDTSVAESSVKLNPQEYFHAMNISRHWLERTNAWEVACTIAAEVYARSQEQDNLVSSALVNSYKNLKSKKGRVDIFNLANRILSLREDNIGQDYVYATIEGRGFKTSNRNDFNINLHIARNEAKVKLECANFKELVKSFRFYVAEACGRMFHPNTDKDEWDCTYAMYKSHKRAPQCTSAVFCEFARKLLNVHWELCKLSDELTEVQTAMESVKAASQKARDNKKIEAYENKKKMDKKVVTSVQKEIIETEIVNEEKTEQVKRVIPLPPAPIDAWKNGNPLVEKSQNVSKPRKNTKKYDKRNGNKPVNKKTLVKAQKSTKRKEEDDSSTEHDGDEWKTVGKTSEPTTSRKNFNVKYRRNSKPSNFKEREAKR